MARERSYRLLAGIRRAHVVVRLLACVALALVPMTAAAQGLYVGPNVNMVSGKSLPDGDPWLQRQNEPSIAVSTRNACTLFAGANDYRTVDMAGVPGDMPGVPSKHARRRRLARALQVVRLRPHVEDGTHARLPAGHIRPKVWRLP